MSTVDHNTNIISKFNSGMMETASATIKKLGSEGGVVTLESSYP